MHGRIDRLRWPPRIRRKADRTDPPWPRAAPASARNLRQQKERDDTLVSQCEENVGAASDACRQTGVVVAGAAARARSRQD